MHRRIGTVYVVALVLVNVAALSLHRANSFGVFHALAVASLVTLAVGLSPLLLGKRSETVIVTHAYCMAWSYAGLVAAGCGQLAVAVGQNLSAWVVPVAIGTMLTASGVIIFARVRRPSVGWLSDRLGFTFAQGRACTREAGHTTGNVHGDRRSATLAT
jgi:uncharacterized membrane protein